MDFAGIAWPEIQFIFGDIHIGNIQVSAIEIRQFARFPDRFCTLYPVCDRIANSSVIDAGSSRRFKRISETVVRISDFALSIC